MSRFEQAIHNILHSLMIQLVFHHFKKNLALLIVWGIIFAAVSGGLGRVYGIHYLFLDPEYLGEVNFWSFFIVGVAFGNLVMAWHITSYILDGHRFRFIGVLQRPFTKFSVNNSFIPFTILCLYVFFIIKFQAKNGLVDSLDISLFIMGLVLGIVAMLLLMIVYFWFTNKDIFIFVAGTLDKKLRKNIVSRDRMMKKVRENKADKYHVTNYLDLKLRPQPTKHLAGIGNKSAILKVFDQNHFNSVVVELIIIAVILVLGFFMHIEFLQIPAAASALLIFAIAVMLVGAISYWFKGWGLAFALGVFILVNTGAKYGVGKGINEAAGLDYDATKVKYSISELEKVHSKDQYVHDQMHMTQTLEAWKAKWPESKKQKMVFLCVSGGGQRAALWAVNALLKVDSALNGTLMDQTFLITGASGGAIGAAYYREMCLLDPKVSLRENKYQYLENMGKDNLNPVIFGLLVNDLFFKLRTHEFKDRSYSIDRGYVFERNLNRNLGGILDKRLGDYLEPEQTAKIPTLILSPTIANDGRKLYVSSQPVSYMTSSSRPEQEQFNMRGVDFQTFFRANSPEDLSFLSALRMSASFPYITPNISLPAEPRVEIMDAGISDNFGISDAIKFISAFKNWIQKNTDGIVFLVVRDSRSDDPIKKISNPSVIDRLTYPIASVYNNLTNMQDINNDINIEHMRSWFESDLDVIEVAYDSYTSNGEQNEVERASLSWHLTTREKQNIIQNIEIPSNKRAIRELQELLKNSSAP